MPSTSVMDDFKIKVGKIIGESSKYQKEKKNCLWNVGSPVHILSDVNVHRVRDL